MKIQNQGIIPITRVNNKLKPFFSRWLIQHEYPGCIWMFTFTWFSRWSFCLTSSHCSCRQTILHLCTNSMNYDQQQHYPFTLLASRSRYSLSFFPFREYSWSFFFLMQNSLHTSSPSLFNNGQGQDDAFIHFSYLLF